MTQDTRIALFLMGELVAALRANDPELVGGFLKTFVGLDETDLASLGRELTHEVRAVRDGFCQPIEKRAFS